MKKVLIGALGAVIAGAIVGGVALHVGAVDMAADVPHSHAVYRLIEWARERSIARQSSDIAAPSDLSDAERARRGAGNYDAMCVNCHLSPGVGNSEIRQGLYPTPPNLSRAADATANPDQAAARRFWIIKHGIKASGMPAWSKGGMEDAAIWDLVAFLQKMPSLSPEQYRASVEASDGHAHGGIDHHHADDAEDKGSHEEHAHATPDAAKGHQHAQGDHAH